MERANDYPPSYYRSIAVIGYVACAVNMLAGVAWMCWQPDLIIGIELACLVAIPYGFARWSSRHADKLRQSFVNPPAPTTDGPSESN